MNLNQPQKGMFITFEGIDGCGKTTQVRKLEAWLREQRVDFLSTREPGGTEIGQQIREVLLSHDNSQLLPYSELLLFLADRMQHLFEVIQPARKQGKLILCDRFHDATVAYQQYGRGLNLAPLQPFIDQAIVPNNPDLTLLLEISPETALKRIEARNQQSSGETTRLDLQPIEFYQKVARGYDLMAQSDPHRFIRVNAEVSPDEVFAQVCTVLKPLLMG